LGCNFIFLEIVLGNIQKSAPTIVFADNFRNFTRMPQELDVACVYCFSLRTFFKSCFGICHHFTRKLLLAICWITLCDKIRLRRSCGCLGAELDVVLHFREEIIFLTSPAVVGGNEH